MSDLSKSHRVLFVDDAVDLLDGLRNGLRRERRSWRMRFAEGSEAALRLLEEEPADVVVSDMRMPGMHGLALLRRVRERWPDTVRVILSGQSDLATVVEASAVAHQYLAKPCDLTLLHGVVQRGFQAIARLPVPELRRTVGALGSLPADPDTVEVLRARLSREAVDLRALAPLAEADPGVLARLLQFTNSPYCGLPRKVLCAEAALLFLGPATVGRLLDTVEPFVRPGDSPLPSAHDRLVRRARLAARVVSRIAAGHPSEASARLSAHLQCAGELVLMTRLRDRWEEIERIVRESGRPPEEVEVELLGADRYRLGAYLLSLWGLPDEVVDAVDHVQERMDAPAAPATETLQLLRCALWLADGALGPEESTPAEAAQIAGTVGGSLDAWRRAAAEEAEALAGPAAPRP